jgi:hypothetical protein
MIDFNRAIKHPFDDKDWLTKGVVGGVISMVPILNFAIMGWMLDHSQNVAQEADTPLPDWGANLSDKLLNGLKLAATYFVYALPLIVLSLVFTFMMGGMAAVADGANRNTSNALGAGISLLGLALMCLSLGWSLGLAYLSPAIVLQFARNGKSIASALNLKEVFAITRANSSDYLMTALGPLFINFAIGLVVSLISLTGIGLCLTIPASFLLSPYLMAVMGHFIGQYNRQHLSAQL